MVGNVMKKGIKNIIFDLGGVIINLDQNKTIKAFEAMGISDFSKNYSRFTQSGLFDEFDKGIISEEYFFERIAEWYNKTVDTSELIKAWNSMLLDFPINKLHKLKEYKSRYRTFLLSNTNETHIRAFEDILYRQHGIKKLDDFFHKVYYSCRMGMRKPDAEIFEKVLTEHSLDPQETVFIDDSPQHVEGAKKLGIKAFLLESNTEFSNLLTQITD